MKRAFTALLLLTFGLWAQPSTMDEKVRKQNIEVVKAAAESLAKGLPRRIDRFTTLVGIKADGTRLVHIFTVSAGPKSDEALIAEGKERMTRHVTAGICRSAARFLKSGITMVYRYISAATKRPLFDVVVTKQNCPFLDE
ncbi:MAG: hypothetical protein GXO33_08070 [Epsilonproteobacteria bacterium]|nr:hypothetical protein [Campylobacterota bacterium]